MVPRSGSRTMPLLASMYGLISTAKYRAFPHWDRQKRISLRYSSFVMPVWLLYLHVNSGSYPSQMIGSSGGNRAGNVHDKLRNYQSINVIAHLYYFGMRSDSCTPRTRSSSATLQIMPQSRIALSMIREFFMKTGLIHFATSTQLEI